MARAHLNKAIIRKTSGLPADGSVQVYEAGTTTPIAATMYVGDTGLTARANPFTFVNGVIDFYLDVPQRVRLVVTPTGGTAQTFEDVDVEPVAAPAATVTFGAVGDITASAVGDTAAAGATTRVADAAHRHAREAFGAVVAQTSFGLASGNGTAATEARSDHTHGTPATPSAAAVGALAITGGTLTGQLFVNLDYAASGTAGVAAFEVGARGVMQSRTGADVIIGDNLFWNGSQWITRETGGTILNSYLNLYNGTLRFLTAPQAAAGSAVAVTQRFSVDATGRLDATTIYDGGQRVYSANNPPPVSGMTVLFTATPTIAAASVSQSAGTFTAPSTGRVAVSVTRAGNPGTNEGTDVSLDNSTFTSVHHTASSGTAVSSVYGQAGYSGLTPGATYTVYVRSNTVGAILNVVVEG